MADNTRMKTMENSIAELTKTLQRYMEESDRRHNEYVQHRQMDRAHLDRVDNQLNSLHAAAQSAVQPPQPTLQPFQMRNIKLDFPRFDGSEVTNWIFKAEQFFYFYETPDHHRLTIAAVHMEKAVVPWFQMISRNQPFQSWTMFTKALEMEFGPSPYESPRTTLFKLTQDKTVADYYSTFTVLANRAQGLSPDATLDCFISGLKPDIKRDVISQTPTSLSRAFALAKLFEDKYSPLPSKTPNSTTSKPYHYPGPNISPKTTPTPPILPNPKPTITSTKNNPVKNITRAEMQLRREKGLCYYCDEKFSITHKCPNRHYYLLQMEDDELNLQPEPPDLYGASEIDLTGEIEHHLSLNALNGSHGAGTMRFQGQIHGIDVTVLLDSGSSDNFLQPRIANCLQIPIQSTTQFPVLVGNGNSLTTMGYIDDLPVVIQGNTLHLPVYLLPITGADLVLGAPWLKTLGPHIEDYNALSISFMSRIPLLPSTVINTKVLARLNSIT